MSIDPRLFRALEQIEANLAAPMTLKDIARGAAMSPYHFHRVFTASVGDSPLAYVWSRRLTQAAAQLVDGDLTVLEVALGSGFGSQASFTRLTRVFSCLAETIQWIQSTRAIVVVSSHTALASGDAARALRRSVGTSGSGSESTGASSAATMSPTSALAAWRSFSSMASQWLNCPSGSSVAWNG